MFKKEKIKDFINFKTLITESVLKWVFLVVIALAALGTIIMILGAWIGAVATMRWNAGAAIGTIIITPILGIIGFAVSALFIRLGFESLLIRFLTYREVKQINEKTKE